MREPTCWYCKEKLVEHNKGHLLTCLVAMNVRLRRLTDKEYEYTTFGYIRIQVLETDGSDTCLLYTSPSPRDRQKSRMPSSA